MSGEKALVPELRFPEFEGEWETKPLSVYLSEPKERNRDMEFSKGQVLSVSGELGCVNQIEHMGRSYAGVSVADYHVVRHLDVVYTKSPLKKAPYGIIKTNFGNDGIVSTLYAVYRPTASLSPSFVNHFFDFDDHLNRYLRPIVRKGAKNDMKVNNTDVLRDPVTFPSLPEQQKIAAFLDAVLKKITLLTQKRAALTGYKRGVMQRLFSGALRFTRPDGSAFPDWEERKLGEVAKFFKGKGVSKADIVAGGATPCIRYGEIYTHYKEKVTSIISSTNIRREALFLSKAGDVIVPASGEDRLDMARACCVTREGVALGVQSRHLVDRI